MPGPELRPGGGQRGGRSQVLTYGPRTASGGAGGRIGVAVSVPSAAA
ncbi:MAG: hypothetical protein JO016_12550 [Actinobacteria bacterium]|nr:hypothetical protein [Actinomycetota bacterium]